MLVLKLDHLGDFLVGLPALERLRAAFPAGSFTLVCAPWVASWAERLGWFDAVVPFAFFPASSVDWQGPTEATYVAFRALGLGRFDLAIDLRHDEDTRRLLTLVETTHRAGFRAPVALGGDTLELALPDTEHVTADLGTGTPLHAEAQLLLLADAVARAFGPAAIHPARHLVDASPDPELPDTAGRRLVVIGIGVGAPIRAWPRERFVAVALALIERHDATIVLIGGASDRADGATVAAALPADRVADLTGKTPLPAVPALVARAALYLGGDTGMTHLAASLGIPTVVIFPGISLPEVWRPVGPRVVVVAGRTNCAPCHLTLPEQCPFGVACLDVIRPADVLAACDRLLSAAETAE